MEHRANSFPFATQIQVKDHLYSKERFTLQWDPARQCAQTIIPDTVDPTTYYPTADYQSHQQRPKGPFGWAYQWVQRYMLGYKYRKLSPILPAAASVLDFGCGIGAFGLYLKLKGHTIYGVEPNAIARKISNANGIPTCASLEEQGEQKFHLISLWHVLEHLHAPEEQLKQFHNHLEEKGCLAIAVPNPLSKDAQFYGPYWAGYDVPRHLWHYSQKGIQQLVEKQGYRLIATYPMPFDAFYISMLSERYKGRPLGGIRGAIQGLRSNLSAYVSGEYSSLFYLFQKN